ncbi:MAG: biotin/lipoyl-binding protein [Ruminococcaceae bacterium]|nr:biotin/lipoyl-binding protein [Oscillospiraceae bacterium]
MRKFSVTVNGTVYEVEVEEIGANESAPVAAPKAAPAPAAAPKAAPAPAAAPAAASKAAAPTSGTPVKAPMPGTIVKVKVSEGQAVKNGDVVCVIEAMKMESDICAPCDGTVGTIVTKSGASVNTDDLLLTIA